MFLMESYLLGERRGSVGYRNAVISALKNVWKVGTIPSLDAIMLAFEESMQHSKLRQLIVDKCAWEGIAEVLTKQVTEKDATLPGFGLELSLALLQRINSAEPSSARLACLARLDTVDQQLGHYCHCGMTFKTLFMYTCRPCSWGTEHACRFCKECFLDWQPTAKVGSRFGSNGEAPYIKHFCAEYHEHEDGVICKNGKSSSDNS